jgi:hypothetical protein
MILEGMVEPSDGGFRLTAVGRTRAAERARRLAAWESILAVAPDDARAFLTIDLPDPATVIDAARRAEIDRAAGLGMAP